MTDPTRPDGDRFDLPGDFRDSQVNIKSPSYHQHHHYGDVPKPSEADLDAATRRLAELPTDRVPDPSLLPPSSRIHLQVNPFFVGREDHLRHLAQKLQVERGAVAVTGIGGLGKTQLASRFVHTYGMYFQGGVFWLSFERADSIAAEVAACGGAGGLDLHPSFGELPQEEQVRRVQAAWQSPLPRLLVFDNCEDEKLVGEWRPTTGGCRVLITSRTTEWSPELGIEVLALGLLSREESIALLGKHRPDLAEADEESLDAVADALGDLPLALHLAGNYLADLRRSRLGNPATYLEALREPNPLEHKSLTVGGYNPTGHEQHVANTFALSYEQLDPGDPVDALARDLLARAACFAPGEPIPRDLLRATIEVEADEADAEMKLEDALGRLVKGLGLLEEDEEGGVVLHRLLGEFVKGVTEDFDAAQDAVETAVLEEAERLNEAGYPAPLAIWQGHLRAVATGAVARESAHAGDLSLSLGYHLKMIADYQHARTAYERALEIHEKELGPEHPKVARDLNNIGAVLVSQGDLNTARDTFLRALNIVENVFGPDHPNVATVVNNLGDIYEKLGDLTAARKEYQRALDIDEAAFGSEDPRVAIRVNNLGEVYRKQGDPVAARSALLRALHIWKGALGLEHPSVAVALNNLGLVLQAQDDLKTAQDAFQRALEIDEKVYGTEHPRVAIRFNNLGGVLQDLGDLDAARDAYQRALDIWEKTLGVEHPNVAAAVSNLGDVYRNQGDLTAARDAFRRALNIDEKVFGTEHPKAAIRVNNLGSVLQDLGDLDAARDAFQRAYEICRKVLGEEHPNTRIARENLEALEAGSE